ncbi:MAG: hypothetical protein DYG98_13160 [Haliscomenobacteraceae bacterium CHB4]|nr:hypothetical protein [Saprospiraceae bacterium]MCE7924000.1 hypothetical protein [Haliscomenobacteraceae bacterium CHB4]
MDTYTFIAEYKGGTYISQMQGASIGEACLAWGHYVSNSDNIPLKNKTLFAETLQNDLAEIPPACLDDTPNVWYFLADAGKGYLHVNVVKTHPVATDWPMRLDGMVTVDVESSTAALM